MSDETVVVFAAGMVEMLEMIEGASTAEAIQRSVALINECKAKTTSFFEFIRGIVQMIESLAELAAVVILSEMDTRC